MRHALRLERNAARDLRVADSATSRALDRAATSELEIPSIVLMEHAAHGAARFLEERMSPADGAVLVLCGPGNNGGDGLALARLLAPCARVVLTAPPDPARAPDAALELTILQRSGIEVEIGLDASALDVRMQGASWIVDAMLGTGLDRAPRGRIAEWIAWTASRREDVIAIDLPSGLDADTGESYDPCVTAAATVTFARPKPGQFLRDGPARCGDVRVVTIGLPEPWVETWLEER
ncbi:MAG: NAD(P)H-hydrate epimerase [Planctomycetes bacterium]|nr:NAD(P)H-hydrate epimerase [Planctomycetota bacterium]